MREKHMTSVDVAVPCYQYGRYLRDAVTSVLNQDVPNLRVVIIDNASSDNSLEVARELMAQDSRVELIAHSTNLGQHASFNEAIDWAKSKYFALLCADDLLVPGSLSRAISVMEKHPDVHLTYGKAHSLARERNKRAGPICPIELWRVAKCLKDSAVRRAALFAWNPYWSEPPSRSGSDTIAASSPTQTITKCGCALRASAR